MISFLIINDNLDDFFSYLVNWIWQFDILKHKSVICASGENLVACTQSLSEKKEDILEILIIANKRYPRKNKGKWIVVKW